MKDALRDWRVWVLFLSLQMPSLRALFKYAADISPLLVPSYLILTWLFYADLLHEGYVRRVLMRYFYRSRTVPAVFALLVVVNFLVYPVADALKYEGRGSDQDDALIITGTRLLQGRNPYAGEVWPQESAAAGPGWVILATPFSATGLYVLLVPVIVIVTTLVLRGATRNIAPAVDFLALLLSSLAFWELMVNGSDMVPIGCLFVLAVMAVHAAWRKGLIAKLGASALLAAAATGRAVFFFVVPLVAGFLWPRSRRQSVELFALVGTILLALHLTFYFWNPRWFLPLHVFGKGQLLLGNAWWVFALLCCIAVAFISVWKVRDNLSSWLFFLWLPVATALFFAGLGDLFSCGFDFARWEGANYVAVQMPVIAAWMALDKNLPLESPDRKSFKRGSL